MHAELREIVGEKLDVFEPAAHTLRRMQLRPDEAEKLVHVDGDPMLWSLDGVGDPLAFGSEICQYMLILTKPCRSSDFTDGSEIFMS